MGEAGSPAWETVLLLLSPSSYSLMGQQAWLGPAVCEGLGTQEEQTWSCPQEAEGAEVRAVQLTEQFESGPCPQPAVHEGRRSETHHRQSRGRQKMSGDEWVHKKSQRAFAE